MKFRKNKRILITGVGSIGSELVRQLYQDNTLYVLDIDEIKVNDIQIDYGVVGRVGDIRDYHTVDDVLSDFTPDIIYHCAAYKTVNQMETVPMEAIQTNVVGTYNILHHAQRYEVPKLVFISTDKVVNAYSVMGQTKKLAETLVINKNYVAVRFGNVLGSRGSVTRIWQRQMDLGRPLTVTDERMSRYLMTLEEAVELVIEAGEKSNGGEIWILDMKQKVNVLELATQIAQGHPIAMIGQRPGETLEEEFMTHEEKERAEKRDKFWVLCK